MVDVDAIKKFGAQIAVQRDTGRYRKILDIIRESLLP